MADKKQKNVKNIIFKILHVICYILSICFIGICILVGVESCNNSNSQKQIEPKQHNAVITSSEIKVDIHDFNVDLVNYIINSNSAELPILYQGNNLTPTEWNYINLTSNFSTVSTFRTSSYNQYTDNLTKFARAKIPYNNGYYYALWFNPTSSNGHIAPFTISYNDYSSNPYMVSSNADYGGSLTIIRYLTFTSNSPLYSVFVDYFNNLPEYNQSDLNNAYDEGYYEGYSIGYSEGLNNGGEVVDTFSKDIIINYDFDFRNLLGSIDSSTGLIYSDTDLTSYSNHLDLTGLTFECNNITYNTIRLVFMKYGDTPVIYTDYANSSNNSNSYNTLSQNTSDLFGSDYTKYYSLISVLYLNIDNDNNITDSVTVYQGYEVTNTFIQVGTGTVNTAFDYRKPHWTNQSFRKLNIIDNSNLKVNVPTFLDTFTTLEIFSEGGLVTSFNVGTLDMFSLIGSAFTSISGIFAISILPNITIGILFFLPLVVTLVVVIIRIIKKG